jgi:hypothetical protein
VPCTDTPVPATAPSSAPAGTPGCLRRVAAWLGLCALSACHSPMPTTARTPSPAPARTPVPAAPADATATVQPTAPFLRPARTVDEYQRQIAVRLMAANPKITYATRPPDLLLAVPVLEVEVNGDGSVRHIAVLRTPSEARDTVQIAIEAVRRAAPFGDATHVPKPWKFMQTFLFDGDRRFKPRILD